MIVAHRGEVSLGATENSVEAIAAAIPTGADMIEVDVQWTADEEFVFWHDEFHPELSAAIHQSMFAEVQKAKVSALVEIFEVVKGSLCSWMGKQLPELQPTACALRRLAPELSLR